MRAEGRSADPAAALAWADAFAAELARQGVCDVCICPGSRSTPLALAFARQRAIRVWMHLDERSAAYFALGLARGRRSPAAVVTTSGTAAANLAPAVVEAFHGGVPLLALTADRPAELRGWGAAQTIEQDGLFGRQVKWSADPGVPGREPEAHRLAAALARRAATVAAQGFPGPVHLNLPFREPLVPEILGPAPEPAPAEPPTASVADAPDGAVRRLAAGLAGARRGLIVCGPHDDPGFGPAAVELARRLRWPLLADALSQVRRGPHHDPVVLDAYDACLREPAFAAAAAPDLVLRFGAPPTSKATAGYLRRQAAAHQVLVDPAGWRDPDHVAGTILAADPRRTAQALLRHLGEPPRPADPAWLAGWQRAAGAARTALSAALAACAEPCEAGVFPVLAELLPPGAVLFAGNSMPVRDLDGFVPGGPGPLRLLANRGANGIDGVLSTALGVAAGCGSPSALVVGDLSFYHDMNGLLAARRHRPPLVVVVIANDGGGIFSFLPQARLPEHFELLFGTPHGLDFGHAARLYGIEHTRPATWADFRAAVQAGLDAGGTHIVEVRSDRAGNAARHAALWEAAARAVRAARPFAP